MFYQNPVLGIAFFADNAITIVAFKTRIQSRALVKISITLVTNNTEETSTLAIIGVHGGLYDLPALIHFGFLYFQTFAQPLYFFLCTMINACMYFTVTNSKTRKDQQCKTMQ
jgi:hypothetical protein